MIQNQLSRRNLDNYVKGSLSLKLEDYFKEKVREDLSYTGKKVAELTSQCFHISGNPENKGVKKIITGPELAKIAGVFHDRFTRYVKSNTKRLSKFFQNSKITYYA
ncbi:hypothetical protein [Methanosarcina sp.]|uniref:hypothetical protein n=1 Tax=Methanosarcina sp. TaxID=2213 RepID=UPI0029886398|nr:hypothetical protein [Methanosarcina sp.]MDW5550718.1 hypothetical protein [Methanosarcina sp.]MDW5553252.1 hypothetical protein [Methanosarcina sp.]MDW5558284.1 hypothetical protein [Methanosarcina sp.]